MGDQMADAELQPAHSDPVPGAHGREALLLQVAAVGRRIEEVSACLRRGSPHVARGLARLVFEWSVLDALLELGVSSAPTREGGLRLWMMPVLEELRARLRRLLQQGAVCGREPVISLALVAHLYLLASKLVLHEATLRELQDDSANVACTHSLTRYRVEHGR